MTWMMYRGDSLFVFLANGMQCVIATHDGGVREFTDDDITTPGTHDKKARNLRPSTNIVCFRLEALVCV